MENVWKTTGEREMERRIELAQKWCKNSGIQGASRGRKLYRKIRAQ